MKATNTTDQNQTSILRIGYISDYDYETHSARVIFPELDDLVSGWLPVIVPNSILNHDTLHLDINEHVACLMLGSGTENGVILGSIYDEENTNPQVDKDTRSVKFEDETEISYNRNEHKYNILCKGEVNITAEKDINLDGDNINIQAKGDINITASGNIKEQASRIDLN